VSLFQLLCRALILTLKYDVASMLIPHMQKSMKTITLYLFMNKM